MKIYKYARKKKERRKQYQKIIDKLNLLSINYFFKRKKKILRIIEKEREFTFKNFKKSINFIKKEQLNSNKKYATFSHK